MYNWTLSILQNHLHAVSWFFDDEDDEWLEEEYEDYEDEEEMLLDDAPQSYDISDADF